MCRPKRKGQHDSQSDVIISKRVQLISNEDLGMVFVRDDKGEAYNCYAKELKLKDHVSESEKEHCLDSNLIMGTNW